MRDRPSGEIFIETKQIGAIVRVTAIDAKTGAEAVFQVPATASPSDVKRMAVNKLLYVMNRQQD